jgi:hypothetical protein
VEELLVPLDAQREQKSLELIALSQQLLEKTGQELATFKEAQARTAKLVPTAADELVRARLIDESLRKAAEDRLAQPDQALEVLINVLRMRTPTTLGKPEETKSAAHDGPYVGGPSTTSRESDAILDRFAGVGRR